MRGKGEREGGGVRGRVGKREREGERKGRKEREEGWEGKAEEREEGREKEEKEVVHEASNSRVLPSSPCCWLAPDQCRENINWFKLLIP